MVVLKRLHNNPQLTIKTLPILFAGDKIVRSIITKFTEKDYHIFSRIANDYGLTVEEKLQEIVDIYLIVEKNKFKQTRLKQEND